MEQAGPQFGRGRARSVVECCAAAQLSSFATARSKESITIRGVLQPSPLLRSDTGVCNAFLSLRSADDLSQGRT